MHCIDVIACLLRYICLGLAEFTPAAVLQKRSKSFQQATEASTLNHKPDAFESFRRGRHHVAAPGIQFPQLPKGALQLHGLDG